LFILRKTEPTAVLEKGKMGIVAHRGFWNCEAAGYARNSVAALRCAQENGFWGSEFDVNITADSVLLVFHDDNVAGKKFSEHPYSEFKDITIENGETIPTIDQYLEQGTKCSETMLVYELKPQSSVEIEEALVNLSIEKLKEYELLDPKRVMFISFSYYMTCKVARLLPDFTVQYLSGGKEPKDLLADGVNGLDYAHSFYVNHPEWAEQARELGMTTNIWTVNTEDYMIQSIDFGIMYITTDCPLEARRVIEEKGVKEVR
jgi:glycerophosphoryl diester phosphodiesterase